MRTLPIVLLSILACSASKPPLGVVDRLPVDAEGTVSVPLVAYRLPLVRASVPGAAEALFCVDTGSSHTLLDIRFTAEADLRRGQWEQSVTLNTGRGPAGTTDRWADVPALAIGTARTRRFIALAADLSHIVPDLPPGEPFGGILGMDLLVNFAVAFERGEWLHLLPKEDVAGALGDLVEPGTAFQQIPVTLEPCPFLELTIGEEAEENFRLLVDTGASRSELPGRAVELLALESSGESEAVDLGGSHELRLHRLPALPLGQLRALNLEVGVSGRDHGLLGYDVLQSTFCILDSAGSRLWMEL